jgi:(E)-4-hydroxy-3-methyl-but-2-enyl pyrophosphate reductase
MRPAIHLAKTAGFCFGVRRAIRMANELAGSGGRVYMLGDLVHNQEVIARLAKAGIKKITRLGNGRGKTLLIRAHGASKALMAQVNKHGYSVADATCPMVHAIHKIVRRMDSQGYRIIVLGDRRHEEVQGIVGQIRRKTLVIDRIANIPWQKIKKYKKAAIVVQSTQDTDHVLPIVEALRKKINSIDFFNTICRPTRMKQAEMKTLPAENDAVIVIGSRSSANTKRLYQIARALNPRSYWIESAAQLKPAWFKNARSIGITAGASTPESATRAVIARIRKMTG